MFSRFLVAVTVARFALFALPVGLFFAAAADASHSRALLATASAFTLGSGLGLWPAGRLLDRIGRWRGLRLAMLTGAGCLVVLTTTVARGWPPPTVLIAATISGVACSPVIATPRSMLPTVVGPSRMPWASGIEATSVEVALILAPLAGAILGRWGPDVVPGGAAGLLVIAATLLPRRRDVDPTTTDGLPLLSRRVLQIAGLALLLGLSGGLMEPGLAAMPSPPFGHLGGNVLLFVAVGVGSGLGGLIAARTAWPNRPVHSVPMFALHAVPLAGAAGTGGLSQLGLLVLAGLPIAPLVSLAALQLDRSAGRMRAGETFGMVATVLMLGTSIGQAIAAQTTGQVEPQQLMLLAAAPPLLAATLVSYHLTRLAPGPSSMPRRPQPPAER